ncbi:MAG: FAD-binding protein [Candidatus Nitrosocaldaceae archaeon]|nr:MAG: FAD-binding protein [Candidatus Nitrosocaldaceae archaeon]
MMDIRDELAKIIGEDKVTLKEYRDSLDLETRAIEKIEFKETIATYPRSDNDIIKIVRFANEHKIPVIPFGGGTGLMGGASAIKPSIIIDMKYFNDIEIYKEDLVAKVGAGVILEELIDKAKKEGLLFAHDPWSVSYATIAGSIATDGLGFLAAGYGSMGEQVLGLDAILPTSEKLSIIPSRKSYANLLHLFIGTEGIFGIISSAFVKLYPLPEYESVHIFEFNNFEDGYNAVLRLLRYIKPVSLDLSSVYNTDNEGKVKEWLQEEEGTRLYLTFHGSREEVEYYHKKSKELLNAKELDKKIANDYWNNRHQLAEYYLDFIKSERRKGIKFEFLHVSIPRSKVLEFSNICNTIAKRYKIDIIEKSIWHFPEFFSISLMTSNENANERMLNAIDEILSLASNMGAFEYCHGIGMKLSKYVRKEDKDVLIKIKYAIDPNNIMNPGKII